MKRVAPVRATLRRVATDLFIYLFILLLKIALIEFVSVWLIALVNPTDVHADRCPVCERDG